MKRDPTAALLLLALAVAVHPAAAQAPRVSQGDAAPQALVVTAENRTAAAEAAEGAPGRDRVLVGDVVRYRLAFTNPGDRPVSGVVLSNPLPAEFRMVGGSVRASRGDARVEFSNDGGRTFSAQPMEEVVVEGKKVRRPAAPETYSHVRWTVGGPVAPGATVTAEFDARLAASPRGAGGR